MKLIYDSEREAPKAYVEDDAGERHEVLHYMLKLQLPDGRELTLDAWRDPATRAETLRKHRDGTLYERRFVN